MFPATAAAEGELLTYLTDSAILGPGQPSLRVGDAIELRTRQGKREIEAWSATGTRLGRLPPAEAATFEDLMQGETTSLQGRISALVPRPLLLGSGRIHIRVQTPGH